MPLNQVCRSVLQVWYMLLPKQAQERSDQATEQPPLAIVPPGNIAGDELNIDALAVARRAVRATQRAAKQTGAVPPAAQQQPAAPQRPAGMGMRRAAREERLRVRAAATASEPAGVVGGTRSRVDQQPPQQPSAPPPLQQQQQQQQQQQAADSAQPPAAAAAGEAAEADAEGAAPVRQTQLQQLLEQLRMQSSGVEPLQAHEHHQSALQPITRAGNTAAAVSQGGQVDSITPVREPAAEVPAGAVAAAAAAPAAADAQNEAEGHKQAAQQSSAEGAAGSQTAATSREQLQSPPDVDAVNAEASRSAWQRIMDSMAAAPTTVRGSAPWKTLQSLPAALPKALPRPGPLQGLPQWRAPWDAAPPAEQRRQAPDEAGQQAPTAQQRLAAQIRGLELRPTARHVLPGLTAAEADAALAEAASSGAAAEPSRRPAGLSWRRVSAATLRGADAQSPPEARREAVAVAEMLGDPMAAPQLARPGRQAEEEAPAQQEQAAAQRERRAEAWRDSQRTRTARFGRER